MSLWSPSQLERFLWKKVNGVGTKGFLGPKMVDQVYQLLQRLTCFDILMQQKA